MKKITYFIAMSFLIAIGCNKDGSNPVTTKANDPALPTSAATGSTSDAIFDIPTPTISDPTQVTPITVVGGSTDLQVCWNYTTEPNSYYTVTRYYPQGNKPLRPIGAVPTGATQALNKVNAAGALNSPYEFWGGSQLTIVYSPAYSGHYDVNRRKSTDGGVTWSAWTEIAETRSLCYTDNNGGAHWHVGDFVQYSVEEKSLETKSGTQANDATHHSLTATGGSFEVCGPVAYPDTYDACPAAVAGGDGAWGANCTWAENANTCSNANMTMNFNIIVHHNTQDFCTKVVTYGPGLNYTGTVCVTATNANDANDIETETAVWDAVNNQYSVTFINPQALETYNLTYDISGACDGSGTINTTSTLTTPDCSTVVTGGGCDPNDVNNYSNFSVVGADGNYPTSKEGNITWVDANDITVKASGQQWNTHFTVDGLNACTNTTTVVPCSANLAIYYCLTDLNNNVLEKGGTTCTGNHYNIDGTNQIPNPAVGTAANYLLKLALDQACTNVIWTINYSAQ